MKARLSAKEIFMAALIIIVMVYAMLLIMVCKAEMAADITESEGFEQVDFAPGTVGMER